MFYIYIQSQQNKNIRALLSVVTVVSKVNFVSPPFENVPQSSGAEVEFHVCNYWTTGCKRSIWAREEEWVEGSEWVKVRQGWKVRKQLIKHWVIAGSIFLRLCLLYSKRNRQGYTVNEMIHNIEEVNIRERNGMVNKCRHQKGFWTVYTRQTGVP